MQDAIWWEFLKVYQRVGVDSTRQYYTLQLLESKIEKHSIITPLQSPWCILHEMMSEGSPSFTRSLQHSCSGFIFINLLVFHNPKLWNMSHILSQCWEVALWADFMHVLSFALVAGYPLLMKCALINRTK